MTKVLKCADLGPDCDFVAPPETEEELIELAAEHGRQVHAMEELTPEMVEAARAVIRTE